MIVMFALAAATAQAATAPLPMVRPVAVQRRRMDNVLYRARGQEPGWTLEIVRGAPDKGDVARFVYDYGKGKVSEVLRRPLLAASGAGRWTSVSRQLAISFIARPCEDVMSGEYFPMTATVTWKGKTYRGCGARTASVAGLGALENAEWIVEDIGGRGIIDNARVTLEIRDGRVTGRSGCNRYFGAADIDGDRVKFGQMGSTRMACAPALMTLESDFLKLMGTAQRWRIDKTGALVMTAADGRTLRARKA